MSLSLKTYEELLAMLRNPHLPATTADYVRAELRSRDITLANQERQILGTAGVAS